MNQPNETPTLDGSFSRRGIGNPAFTEEYANDTLRTRTRDDQKMLFLELGVGGNTPVIIKYPF